MDRKIIFYCHRQEEGKHWKKRATELKDIDELGNDKGIK